MQLGHRYSRAPIHEAIIELRFPLREDVTEERLQEVGGAEFPMRTALYRVNGQTVLDGEGEAPVSTVSHQKIGWSFEREDGLRAVFATLNSFAFVRRGDYDHWDAFVGEVEKAWFRYKDAASVDFVEHVGVRFVNHISIPHRAIDIQDYLRTTVHLAAQLPQSVSNLFAQVTIPFEEVGCDVTISTGVLPAERAFLLDIDATTNVLLSTTDPAFDERLRDALSMLRNTKNFVFEACITDATRSLID